MAKIMINGDNYPYLRVRFKVGRFEDWTNKAFIYKEFLGCFVIPTKYNDEFGAKPVHYLTVKLKDGSRKRFPLYIGEVEIDGVKKKSSGIVCGSESMFKSEEYILGMRMIYGLEICFNFS